MYGADTKCILVYYLSDFRTATSRIRQQQQQQQHQQRQIAFSDAMYNCQVDRCYLSLLHLPRAFFCLFCDV